MSEEVYDYESRYGMAFLNEVADDIAFAKSILAKDFAGCDPEEVDLTKRIAQDIIDDSLHSVELLNLIDEQKAILARLGAELGRPKIGVFASLVLLVKNVWTGLGGGNSD